jgi:ubiquinone/menaquinone biosynthesis C-methylase UbiE
MILLTADVLSMPYKDNMFDAIISNSTLDPFDDRDQIVKGLYEFHRILKQDGTMILTVDNLNNMIVALRNKILFKLLKI